MEHTHKLFADADDKKKRYLHVGCYLEVKGDTDPEDGDTDPEDGGRYPEGGRPTLNAPRGNELARAARSAPSILVLLRLLAALRAASAPAATT